MTRFAVLLLCLSAIVIGLTSSRVMAQFRLTPYVQHPSPDAMTLIWFSDAQTPGELCVRPVSSEQWTRYTVSGKAAPALADHKRHWIPFQHEIRLDGLKPDTHYEYIVAQNDAEYAATFRTAPGPQTRQPMRFVFYADSETRRESRGDYAAWHDPTGRNPQRRYLVDQSVGYALNLKEIARQTPDLILIAGDVTQTGGWQGDWEEFWRHNHAIAASIPILPTPGNHDYDGDRIDDGNKADHAEAKWRTYWAPPTDGIDERDREHYFRLDYGPVTFIALDTNNGDDTDPARDTNYRMTAKVSSVPDFNPGSRQWRWLETQLRDAQQHSAFTIVYFHQAPWSSGPHARSPVGDHHDELSAQPARVLIPLLQRYGVDAVICGHDEMYERSAIPGEEQLPQGSVRRYELMLYDVGIGGDNLRGPAPDVSNPYSKFLAHRDAPEVWRDGRIVSGGKHYGHLVIDIAPSAEGWDATLTPVYLIPRLDEHGQPSRGLGYERLTYDDRIVLHSKLPCGIVGSN